MGLLVQHYIDRTKWDFSTIIPKPGYQISSWLCGWLLGVVTLIYGGICCFHAVPVFKEQGCSAISLYCSISWLLTMFLAIPLVVPFLLAFAIPKISVKFHFSITRMNGFMCSSRQMSGLQFLFCFSVQTQLSSPKAEMYLAVFSKEFRNSH